MPTSCFLYCYNTIAIDLRGRGNSVKTVPNVAPDFYNYTNASMANDVHVILQTLGIKGPLVMVGSVSGGFVVLKYFEMFNSDPNLYISKAAFLIQALALLPFLIALFYLLAQ